MNIVSLDLSSKSSGYAIFQNNTLVQSGVLVATSSDVVKRIEKITEELKEIISHYTIDKVIFEEVLPTVGHNSNTSVWKALTWTQASVVFMLHDNFPRVQKEFIMPNSWRSKIGIHTGKGVHRDALKQADIQYVAENFGKKVNDDEADAICLGCAYLQSNAINWE